MTRSSPGYGYQWRVDDDGYTMALGYAGQYITVVSDRDLVVVFTSGLPEGSFQLPERLTNEYVLPAIVSDDPLPPDPDAQERLAEAVAVTRLAPKPAAFELPEMAAIVDGVPYEFHPNDFGNRSFVLSFNEDSASLRLDVAWPLSPLRFTDIGAPVDIEIGLDGRFITTNVWGQPMAARGAWQGDDTFRIEFQFIGLPARGTSTFNFADDTAGMEFRNVAGDTNQWTTAVRAE